MALPVALVTGMALVGAFAYIASFFTGNDGLSDFLGEIGSNILAIAFTVGMFLAFVQIMFGHSGGLR